MEDLLLRRAGCDCSLKQLLVFCSCRSAQTRRYKYEDRRPEVSVSLQLIWSQSLWVSRIAWNGPAGPISVQWRSRHWLKGRGGKCLQVPLLPLTPLMAELPHLLPPKNCRYWLNALECFQTAVECGRRILKVVVWSRRQQHADLPHGWLGVGRGGIWLF